MEHDRILHQRVEAIFDLKSIFSSVVILGHQSQLLQYVYNISPRDQYTSGKGSSAVGLTAYVTKVPETGQVSLQTGALGRASV